VVFLCFCDEQNELERPYTLLYTYVNPFIISLLCADLLFYATAGAWTSGRILICWTVPWTVQYRVDLFFRCTPALRAPALVRLAPASHAHPARRCAPICRSPALLPPSSALGPCAHHLSWPRETLTTWKHLDATYVGHRWNIWNILLQHMVKHI
jgi:hypothetical protein